MCEIGKFHFICEGQSVYRSKCAFAEMKSALTPFLPPVLTIPEGNGMFRKIFSRFIIRF